jgi:undecaprenyl diphosphate synthase
MNEAPADIATEHGTREHVTPEHITPKHIAIIMDGNGRWAAAHDQPRAAGHRTGVEAAARAFRGCHDRGVAHLTLYGFSFANWRRPEEEIALLMDLCREFTEQHRDEFVERSIRLRVIGDLEELPTATRHAVESAMEATQDGDAMTLTLALGYGGRNDLVGAVRAIAARAQAGLLLPEEIDEASLRSFLTTDPLPDPDLVIRTGGEKRLSDFLLFESAYAELFFAEIMWPAFDDTLLDAAIGAYQRRERRYGRTGEQLAESA